MGQASSFQNRRQENILERTETANATHTGHHHNTTIADTLSSSVDNTEQNDTEGLSSNGNASRASRFRRHLTAFSRLGGLSPNRHHTSSSVSRIPYSIGNRRRSMFGSSIPRRNTVFELPQTHFSISSNQLTTTEYLDLHTLNRGDYTFTVRDLPLVDMSGIENYIPERPVSESSVNNDHQLFRGIIRRSQRNTLSRNTRRALEISGRIRTNNDAIMQHSFNGSGLNAISLRPGEDQAAVLSRLLSVAAAATAASLVGNNEQAIAEAQDIAMSQNPTNDRDSHVVDGSFEGFLRALQNGRLAAALRNGGSENGGGIPNENEENSSIQPLNFFRMFRFGNSQGSTQEGEDDPQNPRLVPIIIVGIRSVPPRDITSPGTQHTSPFFDTLANLSVNMPLNYETSYQRDTEEREANEQGVFSSNSPIHSISMSERPISSSMNIVDENLSNNEGIVNNLEPSRPSSISASIFQNLGSTDQISRYDTNIHSSMPSGESSIQHHNSFHIGSSFTQRHSNLNEHVSENANLNNNNTSELNINSIERVDNNNASRINSNINGTSRNDNSRSDRSSTTRSGSSNIDNRHNSTRSWIIYVLGGSYPEDHPILTTPSLFTDSPTYEDMLLLSSLIGPAKSPVATKDEIESAGGLHVLSVNSSSADIYLEERCVICLNNYEIGEECRQLNKCKHFFHKACIDEWLMTGRNTCPTCRAEGVNSRKNKSPTSNITSEQSSTNIPMTGV
ncbi:hypothetical protein PNEG_01961 [Pneumocystis murina B123]|uniref:RING-type domain-containing protein n=1 Tax=Pneumocystis murina (strain B123) TaxID=1069680 RepID=M7NRB1_PNEMU|nr:hypothetical protein PNEG_01961 [Pneumocystis murina B123]EMR09777.1 hypothetical protein PNEG_01961 [Pneumocystis murina B123]